MNIEKARMQIMAKSIAWCSVISANRNFIITLLLLLLLNIYTIAENRELHEVLGEIDNGYVDFMSKTHNDNPLSTYVLPHTLGIFKAGNRTIVCAEVISQTPARAAALPLFAR